MYSHEEDIDSAIDIFKQAIGHYQSEQVGAAESQPWLVSCFVFLFFFFSFYM